MKKDYIALIFVVFLFPCFLFSQGNEGEENKEKEKMGISELRDKILKGNKSEGKDSPKNIIDPSQSNQEESSGLSSLFYLTVEQGLYVVRRDYGVKKSNGKLVGREGNDGYFGRAYGIGVYSNSKLITHKYVQEPWQIDDSYKQIDSGNGTPRGTRVAISPVNKNTFEVVKSFPKDVNSQIGYFDLDKSLRESLPIAPKNNSSEGFLIIFYSPDEFGEGMEVKSKIIPCSPTWKDRKYELDINISGNTIGGVYFEQLIETGAISFKFSGLYHPVDGGINLLYQVPYLENDISEEKEITPEEVPIEENIEDSKKKKKKRWWKKNK